MRRVLIDECINPRLLPLLRSSLPLCLFDTVRDLGWGGWKDTGLVVALQNRFDLFLTIDKGFEFQHDLSKFTFGVVILTTANNQMVSYERLLPDLIRAIEATVPGNVLHVVDPECK